MKSYIIRNADGEEVFRIHASTDEQLAVNIPPGHTAELAED